MKMLAGVVLSPRTGGLVLLSKWAFSLHVKARLPVPDGVALVRSPSQSRT